MTQRRRKPGGQGGGGREAGKTYKTIAARRRRDRANRDAEPAVIDQLARRRRHRTEEA